MKNTFKQNSYIIGTVSILFFLSFIFGFVYNQNRVILAEEGEVEEVEYEKLKCGREIPVGEAMEKTGKLLEEIVKELERIEKNSYYLIETQEKMEKLAKECSMENCTPKCEIFTISEVGLTECIPKPCQGDPCKEKEEIDKLFNDITNLNTGIQEAEDKIYKLIYQSVEPLCIPENEDIRTFGENAQCLFDLSCREWIRENILSLTPDLFSELIDTCPTITVQKAIERKLNLSRGEFNKCYVSPEDVEKIFLGDITGKYLISCEAVIEGDYPRYTKTTKKVDDREIPDCTSPYNWFCCLDVPQ